MNKYACWQYSKFSSGLYVSVIFFEDLTGFGDVILTFVSVDVIPPGSVGG